MSLLEDIYLQDEANEAQALERIIEGDEYDERLRPHSDSDNNSEREDEAEEEKRKVDPTSSKTRRVIKNPRFILNPARLTGPRGIQVIPDHFKDFKFRGKGHEKEDLDLVLKKLEHWAYRLYPKFQFEDCLKKIETLGKKRPVMVHLQKIRTDQYLSEEVLVQKDSSDDDVPTNDASPEDEFDKLLQQQIELVRSTPSSVKKGLDSARNDNIPLLPKATSSPSLSEEQRERILKSKKLAEERRIARPLLPKATSSPSISEEQRERILKSRKLAEERRIARLKNCNFNIPTLQNNNSDNITHTPNDNSAANEKVLVEENPSSKEKVDIVLKRVNRTNVIESSDEEDIVLMNESITVDIHKDLKNGDKHMNFNAREDQNEDHKNANSEVKNVRDLEDIEVRESIQNISTENNAQVNYNDSDEGDNIDIIVTEDERNNYEAISKEITKEDPTISGVENFFDKNISEVQENVGEGNREKTVDLGDTKEIGVDKDIEDLMDVDFNDNF